MYWKDCFIRGVFINGSKIHCMFSFKMTAQLEYINHLLQFSKVFTIILALCLMLSVTYYVQNYAGIICWSLLLSNTYVFSASSYRECLKFMYCLIIKYSSTQ